MALLYMTRLMPLSKGCQYALRTVAYLATLPAGMVCSNGQLSRRTEIPSVFLSKILQLLTHSGILNSHRGYLRGYSLSRPAEQINARDIIAACDGPLGHEACFLDEGRMCPGKPTCPLHRRRMAIQKQLNESLAGVNACELGRVLPKRVGRDLVFQIKFAQGSGHPGGRVDSVSLKTASKKARALSPVGSSPTCGSPATLPGPWSLLKIIPYSPYKKGLI